MGGNESLFLFNLVQYLEQCQHCVTMKGARVRLRPQERNSRKMEGVSVAMEPHNERL